MPRSVLFTTTLLATATLLIACDDPSFGGSGDSGSGDIVDRDGGHPMFDYSGMAPKSEGDSCEIIYNPCADTSLNCNFHGAPNAICEPDEAPDLNLDWGEPCGILSSSGRDECMDGLHCHLVVQGEPARTCQPLCWETSDCPDDYWCDIAVPASVGSGIGHCVERA